MSFCPIFTLLKDYQFTVNDIQSTPIRETTTNLINNLQCENYNKFYSTNEINCVAINSILFNYIIYNHNLK